MPRRFGLVMLALLAAVASGGILLVPTAAASDRAFDAGRLATFEAAAWQSAVHVRISPCLPTSAR